MPVQTSYNESPRSRAAGMVADMLGPAQVAGKYSLSTRQLEQLTFSTTDGTYTVTINGVEVASFAASSDTAADIRDDILADLLGNGIVAEAVSTDKLIIEAGGDDADDAFTIAIATITGYTKTQLVAHAQEVPFGLGLVSDDRAPSGSKKCRLPRLSTDVARFLGISMQNVMREPNVLGWDHLSQPDIVRVGRVYVVAEGSGTEGAKLYTRYAAGAGGSQLGAFRVDDDTSTAAAVPGLRALEAWSTGGIVLAEINVGQTA